MSGERKVFVADAFVTPLISSELIHSNIAFNLFKLYNLKMLNAFISREMLQFILSSE